MSKVFLVASGKGGTGKTMFAVNLGATYAMKGKKVLVIDMDLGMRNLDLYFGMENNVVYDVYDVLQGNCRIKQALIKDKRFPSLYILAAPPVNEENNLTPLHMKVLIEKLKYMFDFIIIDAPSGVGDGLAIAAAGADEAVIVTEPEYASVRDADLLDRELLRRGLRKRRVIINKIVVEFMKAGYMPTIEEISGMLMAPIGGVIQYDDNIHISTSLGVPVVLNGESYISNNFIRIAGRLLGD